MHYKRLFAVTCGAQASLAYIFLKITMNGAIYCTMITNFFGPGLHGIDVNDIWFQQDGATCHISHARINLLHQTFDVH